MTPNESRIFSRELDRSEWSASSSRGAVGHTATSCIVFDYAASCYYVTMRDFAAFVRLIHEVYPRLHDRVFLEDHPLLRLLGGPSTFGAERLHRTLIDAIEWLRPLGSASPASVEWRRFRHLQLRYVEGESPEQIARYLQVSPRQARRDHAEALDEIARLLWNRFSLHQLSAAGVPSSPAYLGIRRTERRNAPGDSLDAEISNVTAVPTTAPTQIDEIIRGVVETVSRLSTENRVQIRVATSEALGPIAVNRTVLRQLLLTLLSDAITHHPGAKIDVQAARQDHSLAVIIQVWAADRAGPTTARSSEATSEDSRFRVTHSILEVSVRLAQSLDATLDVQPTASGGVVRLTLPAPRVATLLLVDDNPDVALLFRRYLGGMDYRLIQARSAERALRLARELQPDVVILDVLMPSHDGWEILQALRAEPATSSLPIVICSVVPDYALAYSLGVTDFLAKPVTRQALLDVLSRLQCRSAGVEGRSPPGSTDTPLPRAIPPAG